MYMYTILEFCRLQHDCKSSTILNYLHYRRVQLWCQDIL